MLVFNVCVILMFLAASVTARALQKQCRRLAGLKEAWKEYAIALETWVDCAIELEEERGCRKRSAIRKQQANAEDLAAMAAGRLCDCGEYPDADESSPFVD